MDEAAESTPRKTAEEVGRYYDRNTRRFLALGHGGSELAIRRAVWGPGTGTRAEAIEYVNALILAEIQESGAREILDLGCGAGGSIRYLSGRHPGRYRGITVSETQAALASQYLAEGGAANTEIIAGDFTDPVLHRQFSPLADIAFAIESLIHVRELETRLASLVKLVRPGGLLVVCDDMLSDTPGKDPSRRRQRRWLSEFRTGWQAHGLLPVSRMLEAAAAAGLALCRMRDLTGFLELDRPRDLAARAFVALFRWSPHTPAWFANLLGGNALQLCLKNGIIRYVYAVFRREEDR